MYYNIFVMRKEKGKVKHHILSLDDAGFKLFFINNINCETVKLCNFKHFELKLKPKNIQL